MHTKTKQLIAEALKIIEGTRYRLGTTEFMLMFIDRWAYEQTGMYPPAKTLPEELQQESAMLSQILHEAMLFEPTADVLGYILSQLNFDKRGTSYFPTPPDVAALLSRLGGLSNGSKIYEPCCGTGVITIRELENRNSIKNTSLLLEDIDPIMVKCTMLQLIHYFQSRNESPKEMHLSCVDVLSRNKNKIHYHFEVMDSEGECDSTTGYALEA